jgi:hypothetical protein
MNMFKPFLLLLSVVSFQALAGTMECTQYGYTDKGEEFHNIPLKGRVSAFNFTGQEVSVGEDVYTLADPGMVGLEGLAVTYFQKDNSKVLYLYTNDKGDKEIGISHLKEDSDDMFKDKSLFAGCSFKEPSGGGTVGASKASLVIETRRVSHTLPVFDL